MPDGPDAPPPVCPSMFSGGVVDADRTLTRACSPYLLTEGIRIEGGATLRMDRGVEVRFPTGAALHVVDGSLIADAGPLGEIPPFDIKLTSLDPPAQGNWVGIVIGSSAARATLGQRLILEAAGQTTADGRGCITVLPGAAGAMLAIKSATVRACLQSGVTVLDPAFRFAALDETDFSGIAGPAIMVPVPGVDSVGGKNSYQMGLHNLATGGQIRKSALWKEQGVPWWVDGDIEVGDDGGKPTLTLEAGTELLFGSGSQLAVGTFEAARLVAVGSPARAVTLAALVGGSAGEWHGVAFGPFVQPGTQLWRASVAGGGQPGSGSGGCITAIDAPAGNVSLANVAISQCIHGIHVEGAWSVVAVESATFADIGTYAISTPPNGVRGIGAGNLYGGRWNAIGPGTVTETATWTVQTTAYDVRGTVAVGNNSTPVTLIVEPNTFVFQKGAALAFGAAGAAKVTLAGTATAPLVFAGVLPTPGSWPGLRFDGPVLAGSSVTYAQIGYAGEATAGSRGDLTFQGVSSAVAIDHTLLGASAQWGLHVDKASARPTLSAMIYGSGPAANLLGDTRCEDAGMGTPGPCPMMP